MAKRQVVYKVAQQFFDPYSGEVWGEGKTFTGYPPRWAKSDVEAAVKTGLLIEVETSQEVNNETSQPVEIVTEDETNTQDKGE